MTLERIKEDRKLLKLSKFRHSRKAQVIRQLKKQGKSNAEIKLYGPRILKNMQRKEKEEGPRWCPFKRAEQRARMNAYGEETETDTDE